MANQSVVEEKGRTGSVELPSSLSDTLGRCWFGESTVSAADGILRLFPMAAVTNAHKLSGLKRQNLLSHSSGSQKSKMVFTG